MKDSTAQNLRQTKEEWIKRFNNNKLCFGRQSSVDDDILKGLTAQNSRLTKEELTKRLRPVDGNILKGSTAQNSRQTKEELTKRLNNNKPYSGRLPIVDDISKDSTAQYHIK